MGDGAMSSPPSADPTALVGQAFDGTYQVVRIVGSGGLGVVYEAEHRQLKQRRAVKVLKIERQSAPTLRRKAADSVERCCGESRPVFRWRTCATATWQRGLGGGAKLARRGPLRRFTCETGSVCLSFSCWSRAAGPCRRTLKRRRSSLPTPGACAKSTASATAPRPTSTA